MYDGNINAKKLDNYVKQLKIYYKIHNIVDENAKAQLASL